MIQKVWFITGCSRGFGHEWAIAALERGDKVVATARDSRSLDKLVARFGQSVLALELDVTDRSRVFEVVSQAHEYFGHFDVVVNNAGYGQYGMVEEISEEEARKQIETNFFGALWVTQAWLPVFREQRSGHFIQVSSVGGVTAFANVGIYHASKWALEGLSQSLSLEVAPFGIKVTLIEPGGFATDWGGSSARHAAPMISYDIVRARRQARQRGLGNPLATRRAILQIVDADVPPLRVFFGIGPLDTTTADYESRLAVWQEWQQVSIDAQGGV
jgi:NAD(P)-dependent dehydrogenase (short-subunit alcohol dehydrogenase family)